MTSSDCWSSRHGGAWFLLACASVLFAAATTPLSSQTTGAIEGSVTDQTNAPLPGVTVELASPNLQGTRSAVTSADGRYRFPALPPGIYTVSGELPGFGKAQKRATVSLDATTTLNLSIVLSASAEVTVTGEAPVVDFSSTTTGTNYTSSVISRLPTARNYADIVKSNPGVSTDRGDTQGRSLALSIYGATSAENQWIIDGVNTTNGFKGVQGKTINNEFVQEVEVKTGGYQAEYGRALGGVVNVITKSGGNEFHGDGFVYYDSTGTAAEKEFKPGRLGLGRCASSTASDSTTEWTSAASCSRTVSGSSAPTTGSASRARFAASGYAGSVRPRTGFRSTRRTTSTPAS